MTVNSVWRHFRQHSLPDGSWDPDGSSRLIWVIPVSRLNDNYLEYRSLIAGDGHDLRRLLHQGNLTGAL